MRLQLIKIKLIIDLNKLDIYGDTSLRREFML